MELRLVLVRTAYSSNLGSAARVVGNMGVSQLICIDRKSEINSKAWQGAAGAQKYLQDCRDYATWGEFLKSEPDGVRIALTGRLGKTRTVLPLRQALQHFLKTTAISNNVSVLNNTPHSQIVYLVCGPEADGLSADDLQYCQLAGFLPVFGDFKSYNLAQAALLGLFICNEELKREDQLLTKAENTATPLQRAEAEKYWTDLQPAFYSWLESLGMDLSAPYKNAAKTLQQLFLRSLPTEDEIQVFSKVLHQTIRRLREK